MSTQNILFTCVARIADNTILASHASGAANPEHRTIVEKVVKSDRISEHKRLVINTTESSTNEAQSLGFKRDDNNMCLYLVIVRRDFPQRIMHNYLDMLESQFMSSFGSNNQIMVASQDGLTKSANKLMSRLAKEWDDPARVDSLAKVHKQVDDVKGIMNNNISTLIENTERLEGLQDKTDEMMGAAAQFEGNSKALASALWWQNKKILLIICILVTVIILFISIPIIIVIVQAIQKASEENNDS